MGNVTMEETTDGEHKMQVEEEGALNETVGDAIIKESTDGEHKAQGGEEEADPETVGDVIVEESTNGVREEEGLNETSGDIIVEESTDIEHKEQVREEEAVTETLGDVVVEENTDGEHKAQVGGEKQRIETVGVVIVEESTDGEHMVRVGEEDVVSETVGVLIVEESTDSEQKEQVVEEEAVTESVGVVIVEESTGGKHMAQVGEEEAVTETVVEESTDADHMTQVRKEDVLNETVGCVIVEESTGGEHKAQAGEGDVLNVTMVDALVEESTDGKQKTQLREEVAVLDEMGNVIAEETTEGDHKAQVGKGEAVSETMCNAVVEGSTDGEHMAQVREEAALNRTMGDVIVEESTGGEPKEDVGEEEAVMNETEKQVIESMASETRIIPLMENDQHVHYHLPPLYKANFSISDLVWGKVKSHPWWPGQIFDPSDATKLAMKYQKKDSFLVGYFGDKTFAWCDESQLKPFHSYFSQLEKQCSSDTFVKAIRDILTEASRRVELGMACSCLSEEEYTSIKYQKVENAGIRGGNINSIIDRHTVANYFRPDRLLDYIEALAKFPSGRVDKLEFVIAQSQLKAFYHSKGYTELPAFTVGGGLVEGVPESSPSSVKGSMGNIVKNCPPVPSDLISAEGKLRNEESSFKKREHGLKDDSKQKSISKLTEDGSAFHLANGGKSTSVAKAAERPISSSSGKKHIIVESDPVDSGRCKKRILDSFEDMEIKSPSPTVISSFKIGEFIRRAASQLTGAPPIVKCQGETLQKCGSQAEPKKDNIAQFDVLSDTAVENQRTDLCFTEDYNSPDEMLSQLCLAARDPMEQHDFVSTIVAFFTGFRNFRVSSSSEDKEHIEKRKRGRPRKLIPQQASSDVSSSEDEKHVEKRQRGMLKNVIFQLASSDFSSEEEKPVVKRKRGRPRKNPQPASSDSEDKKPVEKHKRGRPRGRPKKVEPQLASPDYNSSENKKPVEKRKRGRPKKVNAEIVPSDICTLDHMNNSYWSDMDLQKKRNGKSHIQYQRKRRKSTGEQSLSLHSSPMPHVEQQLQLLGMNPNMRHAFLAERSIVSVEEKIMDECMPTALLLSFNNANSLPSETDLIRIFSRFGPLKEAETDVLKKTNQAKVVFKRRVDAETAFSSAGKYNIFGPGLLSYQLKPWTPRSASQDTPQDTQNAAPAVMDQDNHDAAPITMTAQDNCEALFVATPQDNPDLAPITIAQDSHDLAPMTMVQDNHDAAAVITLQDKCEAGPSVESDPEFSEQGEPVIASDILQVEAEGKESLPHDRQDPPLIATPPENPDAVLVASPLHEHDITPTSSQYHLDAAPITTVQDNYGAAAVIRLQDQYGAGPTAWDISEQVEDVIASDTIQFKESSSPQDKDDTTLIVAPQENQDAVPVASPLEHDSAPTSTQDNMNADNMDSAAPITMVLDNCDAAAVMTLQDKCDAELTVGSNLEHSEQAEDVIASEAMQIEAECKGSTSNDEHDLSLISAQKSNQDVVPLAPPLDEHDLTPTCAQDNLDAAPITMVQDNHGAAAVFTLHKCDAGTTEGCKLELSEKAEDVIVSDTIQVEAENEESLPQENLDPALISTKQNEDAVRISSLVEEHGLTPNSTQDNLDASPITMAQDNHDAATAMTLQDKCDAGPTVRNLDLSEQAKDVTTLDAVQVEAGVKESLPEDNRDPSLTAASEQNQDAEHIASLLDKHDSTPSTSEGNLDAASISMPRDNHGAAPIMDNHDAAHIGTLQDYKDGEPIAPLPEGNHAAAPTAALQDNHGAVSIAKPLDHRDAARISTAQDNHDAASIAKPQDMHDLARIAKAQDCHNSAPTTSVQDDHDAEAVISPQEKSDAGQAVGSNLEIPEKMEDVRAEDTIRVADNHIHEQQEDVITSASLQVEADGQSLPQDNHDPALIATPQQKQDEEPMALLREKDDAAPSTMQDNLDAAHISMPQGNHDAAPINIPQDSKDAASITTPQDDQDATPQDNQDAEPINKLPEDNHDAPSISTPEDNHNAVSISTPSEHEDAAPITRLQDSHDAASIPTPQEKHGMAPITTAHECHDVTPIITVVGNNDGADKCNAGPTIGSNLEHSEQAEGVIAADTIQVEAPDNELLPQDKQDQAMGATSQQNQDVESVASLLDKHDSRATTAGDNIDATLISMPEDNHDAPSTTTPQDKYDAVSSEDCNLEVSEQAESGIASETMQVEAKDGKLESSGQSEFGMASNTMQV